MKIGNSCAFWGDRMLASSELLAQQPDLDYLTLDYLAEFTMSILSIQKEKEPSLGYAHDFIEVVQSLIPYWKGGGKCKIITNAGGLNPLECAHACRKILGPQLKLAVVTGDNVLPLIKEGGDYPNLDSHQNVDAIRNKMTAANAYLGAKPIVEALKKGADIVITGRVTDPSLTLAPCVAQFGWDWTDYNKLSAATIAGHLIECGTQVTGGISTQWETIPNPFHIGYPFVEMSKDGSFIITKPSGTGGIVNEETVKEQLLYEIGDPDNFYGPDVTVSFLSLNLKKEGENRIKVSGAVGKPPPEKLKVSATYPYGFRADGMLIVSGPHALRKAKQCGEIVLTRLKEQGYSLKSSIIECVGSDDECLLHLAAIDDDREVLESMGRELTPLVTCGPQGVTGYTFGRPKVRPVFKYWPCLIGRNLVHPKVEVL